VPWSVDPASHAFVADTPFLEWTAGASACFPNEDEARVLGDGLAEAYEVVVLKRGREGVRVLRRGSERSTSRPRPPPPSIRPAPATPSPRATSRRSCAARTTPPALRPRSARRRRRSAAPAPGRGSRDRPGGAERRFLPPPEGAGPTFGRSRRR
jgi:hypothetical protein